jgi:hypothetical protein
MNSPAVAPAAKLQIVATTNFEIVRRMAERTCGVLVLIIFGTVFEHSS